jgi:uncharacterized pyridoxal phosphate-containing UPF0001 family protein
MTIGSFDHDLTTGPNPDFIALRDCKTKVCQNFGFNADRLELSMGMSNDFEHAVSFKLINSCDLLKNISNRFNMEVLMFA